jgi:hypothetical protein
MPWTRKRSVPELRDLQARFAAALLSSDEAPAELFSGSGELAARRFALYRGNLSANWDRSLGNAYPVLRQLLGAEFFRGLAREYGRDVPLCAGDLNRFGDRLPEYLETFEPLSDYPYMPDVARLEWALHTAHYAHNAPAASAPALASMDTEALGALRLRLHPACSLVYSAWAVEAIWRAHQPGGRTPGNIRAESRTLICRPAWRAEVLPLSRGEFAALDAIRTGADLGTALETAQDAETAFDPAVGLSRWLGRGAFLVPADPSSA